MNAYAYINTVVEKNNRAYVLGIPQGSPFADILEVLEEMKNNFNEIVAQDAKAKQEKEAQEQAQSSVSAVSTDTE